MSGFLELMVLFAQVVGVLLFFVMATLVALLIFIGFLHLLNWMLIGFLSVSSRLRYRFAARLR